MSDTELKWYIVQKLGSRITKSKILRNHEVYNQLSKNLISTDITYILNYLEGLGFNIYIRKPRAKVIKSKMSSKVTSDNKIEQSNEEYEQYIRYRVENNDKIMKDYYNQKYIEKCKQNR